MSRTAPARDSKAQTRSRPMHSLPGWAGVVQLFRPAACAAIASMRVSPLAPQVLTQLPTAWMPMAVGNAVYGRVASGEGLQSSLIGKRVPLQRCIGCKPPQLRWQREQRAQPDNYAATLSERRAKQSDQHNESQATKPAKPMRTRGWLPDRWPGPSATRTSRWSPMDGFTRPRTAIRKPRTRPRTRPASDCAHVTARPLRRWHSGN
jgi:hypothetical protein